MQWHIITGSKGGVGKTLLTLLLLGHQLERKPAEGILVLDLNVVNTDTSAILLYNKKVDEPIYYPLKGFEGDKDRKIMLQRTYSFDRYEDTCYFGVGRPSNPFALYEYNYLSALLCTIRNDADRIAKQLKIPPLQSVIIDTNYHFCNIFSADSNHDSYKKYRDTDITKDMMTIWFLWVYRQLSKFIRKEWPENNIMVNTASNIENLFNNRGVGSIVHTYTPVGLLFARPEPKGILERIFVSIMGQPDYTIAKLADLEKLPVGDPVSFKKWMQALWEAHTWVLGESRYDDDYPLFVDVLDRATRRLAKNDGHPILPLNIFPLSIYQGALEGYTDREREDAVARLRKFQIYANFSKLLDRKYESFLL